METQKILVAFATHYGSTQEAAEEMAQVLREAGWNAEAIPAREVTSVAEYGAVVIGTPLQVGKWHKDINQFLTRCREELTQRPVAVFALGPIHDTEEEVKGAKEQLDNEMRRYPWLEPVKVEIFVGKFDPSKLQFPASLFMKAIPFNDEMDHEGIRAWALTLPQVLTAQMAT
jgi:menaquinone-dependent protoporphyrinogen oxidase